MYLYLPADHESCGTQEESTGFMKQQKRKELETTASDRLYDRADHFEARGGVGAKLGAVECSIILLISFHSMKTVTKLRCYVPRECNLPWRRKIGTRHSCVETIQ